MEPSKNPLGSQPVDILVRKFAIPSIIAMLVSALYNIVDQFFIGHAVGQLGNAATNVVFPLNTSCTAFALLFGIGGASSFNLNMGRGNPKKAIHYVGNAAVSLFVCGTCLMLVAQLCLTPMLRFFSAPDEVLPYAQEYVRIVSLGFPFLIFSNGGAHLIRADGSPQYSMLCNLSGAIVNTGLDALFVFGFHWGMRGAALATVIGQVLSAFLAFRYLRHYKTVKLERRHLLPKFDYIRGAATLGMASFLNQLAMMVVQIVTNKSLTYYGGQSIYGESIPLACAGIGMKVIMVFFAINIGIAQAIQPVCSFNYGAQKYSRVKQAYFLALKWTGAASCIAFLLIQIFPRQIIGMFGSGDELYIQFAVRYFRIFLFFTFLNFIQPVTSTVFTAIGKPKKGTFLSLTRQTLFLLPLLIIFPLFFGIDGILYAAPVADFAAAVVSCLMMRVELREMREKESALPFINDSQAF